MVLSAEARWAREEQHDILKSQEEVQNVSPPFYSTVDTITGLSSEFAAVFGVSFTNPVKKDKLGVLIG